MYGIVLVVEAQRVHADVDARPDGELALRLATGHHLEGIVAALVPGPGAGQVILRVEDRGTAGDERCLQLRMGEEPPGCRVEEVEALEDDVRGGEGLQRGGREQAGHLPAKGRIEARSRGAVVGVGEQEAAVAEVAPEGLQLARCQGRKVPLPSEIDEGVVEEAGVEGQRAGLGHHLHRGAALELPGDAAQAGEADIPAAGVLCHRRNEA